MAQLGVSGIQSPLALALLAGLSLAGLTSLESCADARGVSVESGQLEQVRLGFGLDRSGRVSTGCAASTFALRDPVHLSMLVNEATAGSVVRVSVRDVATQRTAWSEERPVPSGISYQTFDIGRGLPLGRYCAESTLDGKAVNPRPFDVHPKRDGVR